MAMQKKETKAKKEVKEYKVIGKTFESKLAAMTELKEVFKKGFKNAGLMVRGNKFVILFGSYPTERIAQNNVAAIKKMGITVEVEGQGKK